jgi:hypothetical protein
MDEVARESAAGRLTGTLTSRCPNRDPDALTCAAQLARERAREAFAAYRQTFATDRDLARSLMVQNEYWTAVERFLVGMGGREPVDPDAVPSAAETSSADAPKKRWFRK